MTIQELLGRSHCRHDNDLHARAESGKGRPEPARRYGVRYRASGGDRRCLNVRFESLKQTLERLVVADSVEKHAFSRFQRTK